MIEPTVPADFDAILAVVNEAAEAYRGVIPADCWHDPYMPADELTAEIAASVRFYAKRRGGAIVGVMGLQTVRDVALIRHAYVRPADQRQGVGGALLAHVRALADRQLLVGTWAAAEWAIRFYQRHGFRLTDDAEKTRLLRTYWTVPERQIATSVVLVEE